MRSVQTWRMSPKRAQVETSQSISKCPHPSFRKGFFSFCLLGPIFHPTAFCQRGASESQKLSRDTLGGDVLGFYFFVFFGVARLNWSDRTSRWDSIGAAHTQNWSTSMPILVEYWELDKMSSHESAKWRVFAHENTLPVVKWWNVSCIFKQIFTNV